MQPIDCGIEYSYGLPQAQELPAHAEGLAHLGTSSQKNCSIQWLDRRRRTADDSVENRKSLQSIVELYDPHTEKWEAKRCTGEAPVPGLREAAGASSSDALYTYGGENGDHKFVNSLHRLSANAFRWSELSRRNKGGVSPIAKSGAGMAVCGDMLAVLGGYGIPHGPTQRAGSSFIKNTSASDGRGWTNEFHIYHLNEGMHTCTTMTRICSLPLVVCCLGIHYPSSSQLCWL